MRVLTIASGGSDPNGALLSAVHSAHALSRLGHEVTVLAPERSFVARTIDPSLARVISSPLSRWPFTEVNRIGHCAAKIRLKSFIRTAAERVPLE